MAKFNVVRDPRIFAEDFAPNPDRARLALALDLGTSTGYAAAYFVPGAPIELEKLTVYLGQLDLSVGPYDSRGISACRLRAFLGKAKPDIIFMEDVKYTPPKAANRVTAAAIMARTYTAAEFLGGLKIVVTEYAEMTNIPLNAIPIGSIKKRATGIGNANKELVIKSCNRSFGTDFDPETYNQTGVDNVADAAFCLLVGLEAYSDGVPPK